MDPIYGAGAVTARNVCAARDAADEARRRLLGLVIFMLSMVLAAASCQGVEPDAAPPWMADKSAPQLLEIRFGYIIGYSETPGRGDPGWRADQVRTWYYYGRVTNERLAQQMERKMAASDTPRRQQQMRQAAAQLRAEGVKEAIDVMDEGHYEDNQWRWGMDVDGRGEHVLERKLIYKYPMPGTKPLAYGQTGMLYEIRVLTPHLDLFEDVLGAAIGDNPLGWRESIPDFPQREEE